MYFSGSNGSCNFPDTIYALMHLQKPSSDSDRRQALAFHNKVAAEEYLFFPLVPILSALIGCLGMHLETWKCTDTVVLWDGGGCHQNHFLFKLEWQWGKARRLLIRKSKVYTRDTVRKFSSLLFFLSFPCFALFFLGSTLFEVGGAFSLILHSIVGLPYGINRNNTTTNNSNNNRSFPGKKPLTSQKTEFSCNK